MAAKNSKKSAKKYNAHWKTRLIILAAITLILGLSLIWRGQIDRALGLITIEEGAYAGEDAGVIRGAGGDLVVHFIDVGQGDACVVELPDKRTLIIDAGPAKNKTQLLTYLDENLSVSKFDFAILTHSDEDHCGGFPDVLEKYPVGTFYRPNELSTKAPYQDPDAAFITGSGKKDTVIYRNTIEAAHNVSDKVVVAYCGTMDETGDDKIMPDGLSAGDEGWYEIVFFGPYGHSYPDHNNYSPVIIAEYEGKRIALSGDAEQKAEQEFVEKASAPSRMPKFARFTASYTVDVIKLGHHGSRTSSREDYLNTLTAPGSAKDVLIIISCGFDNSYGHPHKEVLTRLNGLGFSENNILRTDQNSDIVLSVRYDETAKRYLLFHGAAGYYVEKPAADLGFIALTWLEIAVGIWIVCLVLTVFQPFAASAGAKQATKQRSRKKR